MGVVGLGMGVGVGVDVVCGVRCLGDPEVRIIWSLVRGERKSKKTNINLVASWTTIGTLDGRCIVHTYCMYGVLRVLSLVPLWQS